VTPITVTHSIWLCEKHFSQIKTSGAMHES